MKRKKCPRCGSKRFAKSRIMNFREQLSRIVGNRFVRCIDCDWRGQLKDARGVIWGIFEFLLVVVVTVWIAISAYYLFQAYLEDYRDRLSKPAISKPVPKPKPPPLH